MRMRKYVFHLALVAALGVGYACAQAMPQQRDPSGAPQQPSTSQPTAQAPAATGDVQSDIQSALQKDPSLSSANINVQVSGNNVELTGTAPSKDAKDKAEQIAKSHSGGMTVKNHIKVAGGTDKQ